MFNRVRNHLPDASLVLVILVFVLMLPLFLVVAILTIIFHPKEDKAFLEGYKKFLSSHEGEEFFCYTNRKNSEKIVERTIIPELDESIHVIKLLGKDPSTDLSKRYISYALYHIKNPGFPNVMKVVNGELVDYSLHKKIYDAISSGQESKLKSIVYTGLSELREQK